MILLTKFNLVTYCDSQMGGLTLTANNVLISTANNINTSSLDPAVGIALFAFSMVCWCGLVMVSNLSTIGSSEVSNSLSSGSQDSVSSESIKLSIENPSLLDSTGRASPQVFVDTPTSYADSGRVSPEVFVDTPTLDSVAASVQQVIVDPVVTDVIYEYNNNNPLFLGRLDLDKLVSTLKLMIANSITPLDTVSSLIDFDNAQEIGDENPSDTLSYRVPKFLRTQLVMKCNINNSDFSIVSDPSHFIVGRTYSVNDDIFADYDVSQIANVVSYMLQEAYSHLSSHPAIIEHMSIITTFLCNVPVGCLR